VDLKEALLGEVEIKYKSDVSIVRKLSMFGDRIIRSKAKQVEEEFTKNLQEKLRDVV
jgi:carbon monoxide dehydrogenase subunit G